jgi:hypothetical protein
LNEQAVEMIRKALFWNALKTAEKLSETTMQGLLFLCKPLKRYIHLVKKITEQSVNFDYFSFFFMAG